MLGWKILILTWSNPVGCKPDPKDLQLGPIRDLIKEKGQFFNKFSIFEADNKKKYNFLIGKHLRVSIKSALGQKSKNGRCIES